MAVFSSIYRRPVTRRRVLTAGLYGVTGLALYSGEIARHWIDVTYHDVRLAGLPQAFDGMRIAQVSDIHMAEYTETFFLRHVVETVNHLRPDAVFLTGDFVSNGLRSKDFARGEAWHCAEILNGLDCRQRYAVLGNHDLSVGAPEVTAALDEHGITLLRNSYLPIERKGGRFWLAGVDDPVIGRPEPDLAVPPAIRKVPNEPVILMCHGPDYADTLLDQPAGKAVDLMLSGHTHGGQVRLPIVGALELPEMGKKYVEGMFRLGDMQLYVNRGIGTIGLPFRLNCPPEITMFTLRAGQAQLAI
jgi:predicted MPP superfamily phosphohydrolase